MYTEVKDMVASNLIWLQRNNHWIPTSYMGFNIAKHLQEYYYIGKFQLDKIL
jgi:hypothetical protein